MSIIKTILYLLILFILIIIIFLAVYYYLKKYILDIFLNYEEKIQKLQGFNKLKNEQHILRSFIFNKPDFNKRYIVNNLINKNEINILKNLFKLYSKNITLNSNKQIHVNLIDNYAKIPENNHILLLEKIIFKVKKKIQLLYNLQLKTAFYTICSNQKDSIIYPHSDCKSFDKEKMKFIDNMCPDRHFSVLINLNNNYKGGFFKFCNNNKIIKIKKGQSLFFDANEVYEITKVNNNKRLVFILWFTKI